MPVEYPLYAKDVVSITVFREPDLSIQNVPISADGVLTLPLIGRIMAAGQTPTQLQRTLKSAFSKGILQHPDVTVTVMDYASHYVTVEGAVSEAGIFKFPPGTRLSGAIALGGGETRVAKDLIIVMRPTPEGMTVAKFDYGAMRAGTMIDPLILPGDRVIMGKSALAQFWQDLLVALPAFTIFTRL